MIDGQYPPVLLEPLYVSDQDWTRALTEPDDEMPPEDWGEDE